MKPGCLAGSSKAMPTLSRPWKRYVQSPPSSCGLHSPSTTHVSKAMREEKNKTNYKLRKQHLYLNKRCLVEKQTSPSFGFLGKFHCGQMWPQAASSWCDSLPALTPARSGRAMAQESTVAGGAGISYLTGRAFPFEPTLCLFFLRSFSIRQHLKAKKYVWWGWETPGGRWNGTDLGVTSE